MRLSAILIGAAALIAALLPSRVALAWKCHHRCPRSVFAGKWECQLWKRNNRARCRRLAQQRAKRGRAKGHRRPVVRRRVDPPRPRPRPSYGRRGPKVPSAPHPRARAGLVHSSDSRPRGNPGVQTVIACNHSTRHRVIALALAHRVPGRRWRTVGWFTIRRRACRNIRMRGFHGGYAWYAKAGRSVWRGGRRGGASLCIDPANRFDYTASHVRCGRYRKVRFRWKPVRGRPAAVRITMTN